MKLLTLRFAKMDMEREFLDEYFKKSIRHVRFALLFGAFLYAIFGFLDGYIIPELKIIAWVIRYVFVCPLILTLFAFSFSKSFKKFMQVSLLCATLTGGLGIIAMILLAHEEASYLYYAGLIIVIMYSYTFVNLRFAYASVACWIIVFIYEIIALKISNITLPFFVNNSFFLISANLIGMFANYQMEMYSRNDFLRSRKIKEMEERKCLMEKQKIIKDLHDGICGVITNIHLLSEMGQKKILQDNNKIFNTISELSSEAISELRMVIDNVDNKEMNWQELVANMRNFGCTLFELHGITFAIQTSVIDASKQSGTIMYLNIFRIYKEALVNIIKHAKAQSVQVFMRVEAEYLSLSITDDGVGLTEKIHKGRGMANMYTRALELGGKLSFIAQRGTTVHLELPLLLEDVNF